MAVKTTKTLAGTSADVLNAIRNSASTDYKNFVPVADINDDSTLRSIGAILTTNIGLQNEWASALVNRIGLVLVSNKMYTNPWAFAKWGTLEFGETIEDVFVNLPYAHEYDLDADDGLMLKKEKPDIKSTLYIVNYQKYYKQSVNQDMIKRAFLSWDGVTDLIGKVIESMYSAAALDEFTIMKYVLARRILDGRLYPVTIKDYTVQENIKSVVSDIKNVSNDFIFMSNKYNPMGVSNYTNKEDQYVIVSSKFDATMDVEVLASAFNMDKADFMGRRVLVDSFGSFDDKRLESLLGSDPNYTALTQVEKTALDKIPAVLVDKNWFIVVDNNLAFTDFFDRQKLEYTYWLHNWKTVSASPFVNAAVFVPEVPTVTSVTVTPGQATVAKGQSIQLDVKVATTGFAPQTVSWKAEPADNVTVSADGKVTIGAEHGGGEVTVTATSTYDTDKSGKSTITVSDLAS